MAPSIFIVKDKLVVMMLVRLKIFMDDRTSYMCINEG